MPPDALDLTNMHSYGAAALSKGSLTIPADARRDLGIDGVPRLLVFGDPAKRFLILYPEPPVGPLLDLAAEHAAKD